MILPVDGVRPPMLRLGLKFGPPAKLRFSTYFDASELPSPPPVFGYGSVSPELRKPVYLATPGILGNATWGDCVWAGAAHEVMYWEASAGKDPALFTDDSVLSDYAAVTGFAFTADSDQGTDMVAAAQFRQKTGNIDGKGVRHQIDTYASLVPPNNVAHVVLSCFITGVCAVGVTITENDMKQFMRGEPFAIVVPPEDDNVLGGHYIPIMGRNSHGMLLGMTWGRIHAISPAWLVARMQQGIVYIDREDLDAKGLSPQGFNLDQLNRDFRRLTA